MPVRSGRSAAVAARIRLRYAKAGKARFISAIDLGRVWARALRRADLPIAYSEGFSPHPKVSFPDALPLGYASTGEYAELTFAAPIPVAPGMAALDAAFPEGIRVLTAVAVADGDPKLASLLRASAWDLDYPDGAALPHAVAAASAAQRLPVPRRRKGEPVTVDLRPALHQICCAQTSSRDARVRVTLHHVEPPVRPTEVDLALRRFAPDLPPPARTTRLAQGRATPEGLIEALSGELVEPLQTLDLTRHPT